MSGAGAGKIVKIDVAPARTFSRLAALTLAANETNPTSAVLDASRGVALFGTWNFTIPGGSPGVDVDPAHTFARLEPILLGASETPAASVVVDPVHGFGYVGTGSPPAVVRFDLATMRRLAMSNLLAPTTT